MSTENDRRIEHGHAIVLEASDLSFEELQGPGIFEECASDALTDILHACAAEGLDWRKLSERAARHVRDELGGVDGSTDEHDDDDPLGDPPAHLADAWERYQHGGHVEGYELSKLDEWRAECAENAGF